MLFKPKISGEHHKKILDENPLENHRSRGNISLVDLYHHPSNPCWIAVLTLWIFYLTPFSFYYLIKKQ